MAISQNPQCFLEFKVRHGEVGSDGFAKISEVANWFQETAGVHADLLGIGDDLLRRHNIAWILARMSISVTRLPYHGESVKVRTWPAEAGRFYLRGYELIDASGNIIVKSTSKWVTMDIMTRKLTVMPSDLLTNYPKNLFEVEPFEIHALPHVRDVKFEMPVLVRHDDLDINGHVNNAKYFGWLKSFVDHLVNPSLIGKPFTLDAQISAECFASDMLSLRSSDIETINLGKRQTHGYVMDIIRGENIICRAVYYPL